MSDLVGNPKDRVSRVAAYILNYLIYIIINKDRNIDRENLGKPFTLIGQLLVEYLPSGHRNWRDQLL